MSKNLTSVAQIEFDSMVKHAYATKGLLKPYVTIRNNVVGESYKFRSMGKGRANQKSTSDEVTPMNTTYDFQTCTLQNWNAPEYTDIFDQTEVNFDEKSELAEVIAGALGRQSDQLVIDAFNTTSGSTIAHGGTGLTMAKLTDAHVALRKQGVPNSDLTGVIDADGLGGLLRDEKATSSDYQTVKALVTGDINTLQGFTIVTLDNRIEGGLTVAANVVDSFFFAKSAIGMAIGIDMKTEVNYIPNKTSWLSNGMMRAGSIVRDENGVVKLEYKNNV